MPRAAPDEWTTLTTAPQLLAEVWQRALEDEGIAVRIEPADAVSFLGVSPFPCRLLVRARDYAAAQAALADMTSGPPLEDATETQD